MRKKLKTSLPVNLLLLAALLLRLTQIFFSFNSDTVRKLDHFSRIYFLKRAYLHNPPLYHLIYNFLINNFGSLFSYFLTSVIFSMLAIYFGYRLAVTLYGKNSGFITLIYLAFSPFLVFHSTMLANHPLFSLTTILTFYYFTQVIIKKDIHNQSKNYLLLYISNLLNIMAHVFGLILLFIQSLFIIFKKIDYKILILNLLILVTFLLLIGGNVLLDLKEINNRMERTSLQENFHLSELKFKFKHFYERNENIVAPLLPSIIFFLLFLTAVIFKEKNSLHYLLIFTLISMFFLLGVLAFAISFIEPGNLFFTLFLLPIFYIIVSKGFSELYKLCLLDKKKYLYKSLLILVCLIIPVSFNLKTILGRFYAEYGEIKKEKDTCLSQISSLKYIKDNWKNQDVVIIINSKRWLWYLTNYDFLIRGTTLPIYSQRAQTVLKNESLPDIIFFPYAKNTPAPSNFIYEEKLFFLEQNMLREEIFRALLKYIKINKAKIWIISDKMIEFKELNKASIKKETRFNVYLYSIYY